MDCMIIISTKADQKLLLLDLFQCQQDRLNLRVDTRIVLMGRDQG